MSAREQRHGTRVAGDESLMFCQTASIPQRAASATNHCTKVGGTLFFFFQKQKQMNTVTSGKASSTTQSDSEARTK